jgi:glycosyltransferase involved in cell wall biosynthesis
MLAESVRRRSRENLLANDPVTLLGNGAWIGVVQLFGVAVAFWFAVVSARQLGPDGFSALVWLMAVVASLAAVSRLGTVQSAARVLSLNTADERRTIWHLILGPLIMALSVAVLWSLWLGDVVVNRSAEAALYSQMLGLVAVWLVTSTVYPIVGAVLRAEGKFVSSAIFNEGLRRLPMIAVLLMVDGNPVEAIRIAVIVSVVIDGLAIVLALALALRAAHPRTTPSVRGRQNLQADLGETFRFWPASVAALLLPQAAVWLLALSAGPTEVRHFGLAIQLSLLFAMPLLIGNRIFVPRIAKASSEDRLDELEGSLRAFATLAASVLLLALFGFLAVGRPAISFVFGTEYAGAFWPTVLLTLGVIVNTGSGLCMATLANTGHAARVGWASVLTTSAFILAVAAFATSALAAAIIAGVVQIVFNLAMARSAQRLTGITTFARLPGRSARRERTGTTNVAFFDDRFFEVYGAQENILLLAQLRQSEGNSVVFVTTQDGALAAEARKRGLPTMVVDAPPALRVFDKQAINGLSAIAATTLSTAAYSRRLHAALKTRGVDVVVAASVRSSLLLGRTRLAADPAVVLFAQNSTPFGSFSAAALPGVDVLALISSGARTTFPAWSFRLAPAPMLLPSGRDLSAFAVERHTDHDAALRIVSIGKLSERKGFHVLLDAMRLLHEQGTPAELTIVGGVSGDESKEYAVRLHDLAEADGLNVRFVGWQDDIAEYLRWANCFALASFNEGLPGVILEAMASGLPVVATDAGGCSDVVTEATGAIVPIGSSIRLAEELARLTDPELRSLLGANAQALMVQSYSEGAFLDRFNAVLEAATR